MAILLDKECGVVGMRCAARLPRDRTGGVESFKAESRHKAGMRRHK
jgi:hypothetical protein